MKLVLVGSFLEIILSQEARQGRSTISCNPDLISSATNCNYGQYDSVYAARTPAEIAAAWTATPGVTCGVLDPMNRPGQQLNSRKMMEMLKNPFGFDNEEEETQKKSKRQRPGEKIKKLTPEERADIRRKVKEKRKNKKSHLQNQIKEMNKKHETGEIKEEERFNNFMDILKQQLSNIQYRELEDDKLSDQEFFDKMDAEIEQHQKLKDDKMKQDSEVQEKPGYFWEKPDLKTQSENIKAEVKSRKKRLTIDNGVVFDDNNNRDWDYTGTPTYDSSHDSAVPWHGKLVPCYDNAGTCHWDVRNAYIGYGNSIMISPKYHLTVGHLLIGQFLTSDSKFENNRNR